MTKASSRLGRIADQIQRDVAELIRSEVKDPRVGLVTLTGVEVSPDHRHAKIFFTVLGDSSQVRLASEGLARAAGFLRARLASTLRLRVMPELHFVYDESVARGARLSQLIDEAVGASRPQRTRH
jgi:ribosome-binding factor A